MKVLLASSGSGSRGGGEIYLVRLAEGLTGLGHDVHALLADTSIMDELAVNLANCARVHRVAMRNTYQRLTRGIGATIDLVQQRRLQIVIKHLAPDIVHVNQQVAEDGLDLLLAARGSGLPFLSTIHITRSARALGAKLGGLRDAVTADVLNRMAAAHVVVADHARKDLVAWLGAKGGARVTVIHNGVRVDPLVANSDARLQTRRAWQVGTGDVVIGCVGRLEEQKNAIFALEVCARLKSRGLPVRMVWIGDGPLKEAFIERASALRISDLVHIDGWRDDVEQRLQGLDIFMLTSRFEGLPLALLEAMAVGLPCIVSNVDGMPEAVEHNVSGIVCELDDHDDWCAQLVRMIECPALRQAMGAASRRRAQLRFSRERMSADTEALYMMVIARHQHADTLPAA